MPAAHTSHPVDTLWQAPSIIWSILAGECLALVLALAPGVESSRLVLFGLASFLIQWVVLLTLASLYTFRRRIRRLRPLRVACAGLLGLLFWSWLVTAVVLAFDIPGLSFAAGPSWAWPFLRVAGVVLAVATLGFAALHNHWKAEESSVRAQRAELASLQARTHPHFLFNTLNTAIALLHQRPTDAERVLLDLSDLFRAALSGPRHIPLAEEIDLSQRYLEIEQLRLGKRLTVQWEVPDPLPDVQVPALSIQPLAENAVRHGIERRMHGGSINVEIRAAEGMLQVTVRNPLPDAGEAAVRTGHGVGLPSVAGRIETMTGGRGSLVTQESGPWYEATIRLPLDTGDTPHQVTTS